MPVSLTNSIDIVANSVSLCDEDSVGDIFDLYLQKTDAIQQTVGSLQRLLIHYKIAESINNDGTSYNTLTSQLNTQDSSSDVNSASNLKINRSTTYKKQLLMLPWLQQLINQQHIQKQI